MGKKIMNKKKCIVIMGVAGAGKSTLGNLFTKKKDCVFIEGDDLHSKENKQKMKNGIPLNDEDRFSWLQIIKSEISSKIIDFNVIVSCSALKKKYRRILKNENTFFVYLKINKFLASSRLKARKNHFMPDSLVESQFNDLEEPKNALIISGNENINSIFNRVLQEFNL